MNEVKPLKFKANNLKGISERQIIEHHDVLYAGYVKKTKEIRDKLTAADLSSANATFSDLRELKHEETFAVNGVKLHEGYFDNLGGGGGGAIGKISEMINQDFGSYEKWNEEFMACGIAARGWVVLAFDMDDKKLHNYICDVHNQGGVWSCIPLLILDVYEHAYFLDYGTARKEYLEAFMSNIDWTFVNELVEKHKIGSLRG